MNNTSLSVIIIVKDEEQDIKPCLESVSWAQEIVVVDDYSTDQTLDIVRRYTDKIFQRSWDGYGSQKQFALDQAQGPWILNIDADEQVSPELAQEIQNVLKNPGAFNGFWIPYANIFLGRRLRFGRFGPETHLRLFRKEGARYGTEKIHEGIRVSPPHGLLRHVMIHQSYRDFEEHRQKKERYTSLIAEKKWAQGRRFHWWHIFRGPWEFVMRYLLKLGFLDGRAGFWWAYLSAQYAWAKHRKLRDLERQG